MNANAAANRLLRKQTTRHTKTVSVLLLFQSVIAASTVVWIWWSHWKLLENHKNAKRPSLYSGVAVEGESPYHERNATKHEKPGRTMQESTFHIVFSTGCNAFQGTNERNENQTEIQFSLNNEATYISVVSLCRLAKLRLLSSDMEKWTVRRSHSGSIGL